MNKILKDLFEKSLNTIENNHFTAEQRANNWIGNLPATKTEIEETELRLAIELPNDYKEFVQIANGYLTYNDAVEPSFEKITEIQFLKNFNPELIQIWSDTGNEQISIELARSIIVAGKNEEQHFLLIPPNDTDKNWKYWKFACWIPGELEYKNLQEYFLDTLNDME